MAKKKTFENIISNLLGEPVCNLCHAFYDQYVEANVKFRSRAGMKEVIIRRQLGKCCKWCADLAGIYVPENAPEDIYKRHDNCKCMVTYKDEDGYTDVWSKKEFLTQKEARQDKERELLSQKLNNSKRIKYISPIEGEDVLKDVTLEYRANATPNKGEYRVEDGFRDVAGEEDCAKWLYSTYGGDIVLLAENNPEGESNPDYLWRGKLWDLKSPTSSKYSTLEKRIKKGVKQISKNPGGVVIDISKSSVDIDYIERIILKEIKPSAKEQMDFIIVDNGKVRIKRL